MKSNEITLPEGKLGLFWVMGAVSATLGAWIIGHTEAYSPMIFIAFLLLLFAGLAWVGVSVGVTHHTR